MATETHIVPKVDGEEHDLDDCRCQPRFRRTDAGPVFMHNSFRKTGQYQIVEVTDTSESPEEGNER